MKNLGALAEEGALKAAPKTVLSTAGTALSALGAAYGTYDIVNQIGNAGDIRSARDMFNTRSTNTYTTDQGNQYTEHSGLNEKSEMAYEKAQRLAKQLSFGVSTTGTGASVGALIGSLVPGVNLFGGTLIGAGLGAAIGGLADVFGFGDNEEKIKKQMRRVNDITALQNRQSRSAAENQDIKDQFYSGSSSAAKGKRPVWSPSGLIDKKATARVSNGEVIGNFEDGYVSRVPGKKNNKDTKLANLKSDDFVISNKYGLSDYAAETGDYVGALNMQHVLMN